MIGSGGERIGPRCSIVDLRQMRAARLLAGFESNAAPAFDAFQCGLVEPSLGACGDDGYDARDAELGRFFNHPFEVIELEDRSAKSDVDCRGNGVELRKCFEDDERLAGCLHLREIHVAIVGDFVCFAGLDTEHAREMLRVITRNLGASVAHLVYEKSSPHEAPGLLEVSFDLMIAHLRGTLLEKHPNAVIIDVHGVGYELAIPVSAYSALPDKGAPVQLHVYTQVREDAISLFGFQAPVDKALFEKLISVSGIGPSVAIKAMGGMTAQDLAGAIRSGSIEQLVRIPGVGKKTAERMVLELRDKLEFVGLAAPANAAPVKSQFESNEEDVISALMNFGASRAAGEAAVIKARSTTESNDFDALFRRALKLVK